MFGISYLKHSADTTLTLHEHEVDTKLTLY
jgi:hypothetical protein